MPTHLRNTTNQDAAMSPWPRVYAAPLTQHSSGLHLVSSRAIVPPLVSRSCGPWYGAPAGVADLYAPLG